eukprot:6460156-Amphidinium_carterae.2
MLRSLWRFAPAVHTKDLTPPSMHPASTVLWPSGKMTTPISALEYQPWQDVESLMQRYCKMQPILVIAS